MLEKKFMKNEKSAEELSYEFDELWQDELFKSNEIERLDITLSNLPSGIKTLCDVGCGNGIFLDRLKVRFGDKLQIVGVERSKNAISKVKHEVIESDISSLDIADQTFECVTALQVIEHMMYDKYQIGLSELCRVSSKYVLITVPFNQNLRNYQTECPACSCRFNSDYHMRSYDEESVVKLLRGYGFNCIKMFYMGEQLALRNWFEKLYQFVRAVRRIYKQADVFPMWTICPNCRFTRNSEISAVKYDADTNRLSEGLIKKLIFSFFLSKKSNRWIGCLYERVL
jgi:ubiquinone/menaquinone biosynthesis C-methylase UbiE